MGSMSSMYCSLGLDLDSHFSSLFFGANIFYFRLSFVRLLVRTLHDNRVFDFPPTLIAFQYFASVPLYFRFSDSLFFLLFSPSYVRYGPNSYLHTTRHLST